VQTYYEESLFTQAYTFLLSITGNSVSAVNREAPVTVPAAPHLALAVTVSVHPAFTTRTTSREKWEQAQLASRLLRLVYQSVGPVNGNLLAAFSFRRYDATIFQRRRFADDDDEDYNQTHRTTHPELNTSYADSQSLWARAEDFWHVVGWAFNCACLPGIHLHRWRRYQVLLEFLLDVLETDWQIREQCHSAEESLIWQYIELAAGGQARQRRILRAIFADGSTRSTNEFRPIFSNELKEPAADKEGGGVKKREVDVNIDQEIFGDYLMQDESDDPDEDDSQNITRGAGRSSKRTNRIRTPSSRHVTPRGSAGSLRSEYETGDEARSHSSATSASVSATLGDHSSLNLRLRLLNLLTHISSHPTLTSTSPTTFPDLEDLFTLFVEFIKPLPLPTFAHFVLPALTPSHPNGILSLQSTMTLAEFLLQRLLEASAPSIRSHVLLSRTKLETEYLPFAAGKNTADANARVSILLESLTRCLIAVDPAVLAGAPERLHSAVRTGVHRRFARVAEAGGGGSGGAAAAAGVKRKAKGAAGDANDEATCWLVESGDRLMDLVKAADV